MHKGCGNCLGIRLKGPHLRPPSTLRPPVFLDPSSPNHQHQEEEEEEEEEGEQMKGVQFFFLKQNQVAVTLRSSALKYLKA